MSPPANSKRSGCSLPAAVLLAALAAALFFSTASSAIQIRVGDIVITGDGGFAPKRLPRTHDAPIKVHFGGKISTVSGELPPVLEQVDLEFDRHGHLETLGLPKCRSGRLRATTVAQARRSCPGAIVGTGYGHAIVKFPEQPPIPADSPITLFNGPRVGTDATVIAHAYTTIPVPTTLIVPIVIERIHKGIYGYRTKATLPKIANGYGVPISGTFRIGREWTYRGVDHSYLNARCETGRLQARGEFSFDDGTFLNGTFVRPCKVRR